jgi:serine protease inhibitor
MAFAGAKGVTAAQIRTALRLEAADEAVHAASGEMIRRLNSPAGVKYELTVANALWIQKLRVGRWRYRFSHTPWKCACCRTSGLNPCTARVAP